MTRKFLFNTIFVLAAIGLGIYLSIKPWQIYRQQRGIADQARIEMQKADRTRADLIKKKARIESSTGREELVRNAGYRKPGEVPADQD
jgi:hypothetical protein